MASPSMKKPRMTGIPMMAMLAITGPARVATPPMTTMNTSEMDASAENWLA
ncbi:hypothetical protein L2X98_29840 [Microbacterium elymi]|uniref:Uncharacterized protein n=1 Tax=Microbacterium elymi TaxID=2909587 RepID=A0ABY5NHL3_9MICO|nr:hypothetical protein [Microbacterium elymi]UUT34684.1 hypothetical protein L2X98_29840 [Microbacterium elymi]